MCLKKGYATNCGCLIGKVIITTGFLEYPIFRQTHIKRWWGSGVQFWRSSRYAKAQSTAEEELLEHTPSTSSRPRAAAWWQGWVKKARRVKTNEELHLGKNGTTKLVVQHYFLHDLLEITVAWKVLPNLRIQETPDRVPLGLGSSYWNGVGYLGKGAPCHDPMVVPWFCWRSRFPRWTCTTWSLRSCPTNAMGEA
jgi:hypothetical protein